MSSEITALLSAWRAGDAEARDRAIAAVYPQLRAIANQQLAGERFNVTLQPTALVNEAWLRLGGAAIGYQDRSHFVRIVARLMREILVDYARKRNALKRDGGERVTLSGLELPDDTAQELDLVELDAALARLDSIAPEKARIVELRYFGGLTIEETAAALSLSPATVKRHWQVARVWLHEALTRTL